MWNKNVFQDILDSGLLCMLDWVFCACSIGWLGVLWDSTAWQKIPCYPNVLKSTMPKSMNFLELLCTWCNPGLSREALQVELEVSGRGEHGLGGASIPQVGWLCVVFVCMHVCVCSTCCVCGGQRTTVATSWKLCEFRILNSGCQALEPAPWLTDPFCWPHSSL